MTGRLPISRGFSISLSPTGKTHTHGLPQTGSPEDAVEEWLDGHLDHERREFAQRWLEQRTAEIEVDDRIQGIRTRREEIMKRWDRLTKRNPGLPELDSIVRAMILNHPGVLPKDESE